MSRAERERESRRLTLGSRLNTKLTTRTRIPWDGSTVPTGASFRDIAPGDPERVRAWATQDEGGRVTLHVRSTETVLIDSERW